MQTNKWSSAKEHAGDDVLEQYSMGKLPEGELETFEEHLLICVECQQRLAETDAYVRAAHAAAGRLELERAAAPTNPFRALIAVFTVPRTAWALGSVLLALAISWIAVHRRDSSAIGPSPVAVILQTTRGTEGPAVAPSHAPLMLRIDLVQLPALPSYSLEVAARDGSVVGEYRAVSKGGNLSVPIKGTLAAGKYWVRLYAPAPGKELLREYGLELK